MPPCLP